jgi:hypothetical protein
MGVKTALKEAANCHKGVKNQSVIIIYLFIFREATVQIPPECNKCKKCIRIFSLVGCWGCKNTC